jgi:hypothetical protein
MDFSPEWAFWNAELSRELRIETTASLLLHKRISNRRGASVLQSKGMDEVLLSGNGVAGVEFANFESESEALRTERFSALEHSIGTDWSPESQGLGSTLKRHRPQEPNDSDEVVSVEVREENVVEIEGDPVAHHLALGPLTTIEQESFSLAEKRDGRNVAFDGRSRSGSAEESQT